MNILIPPGKGYLLQPFPLFTRTKKNIEAYQHAPRSAASVQAAATLLAASGAVQVSQGSVYNCMGMVFASRRASIDVELARFILQEDGYQKVNTPSEAKPGDVAVYTDDTREITHVGVIIYVIPGFSPGGSVRLKLLSQWGHDGEFVHFAEQVPAIYGRLTELWRTT